MRDPNDHSDVTIDRNTIVANAGVSAEGEVPSMDDLAPRNCTFEQFINAPGNRIVPVYRYDYRKADRNKYSPFK